MADPPVPSSAGPPALPGREGFVGTLSRLTRALRSRIRTATFVLLVFVALGGLHFATTDRMFQSSAEVLIIQARTAGGLDESSERATQLLMPTFEKLFLSDAVIEAAIRKLPAAYRASYRKLPRATRIAAFRASLGVRSARRTNVLEITARAKQPKLTAAMLNALLAAYFEFMDETHAEAAGKLLSVLRAEESRLDKLVSQKEKLLIELRGKTGELYTRTETAGQVPARNVQLEAIREQNRKLVEAQLDTLRKKAYYYSVADAVKRKADLHELTRRALDQIGNDLLVSGFGLGKDDVWSLAKVHRDLLADQAKLSEKLRRLGPKHTDVIQLKQKIATTERWLDEHRDRQVKAAEKMRKTDLGPRLLSMARQSYEQAATQERSLWQEFERERRAGMKLNDQLAQIEIIGLELERLRSLHNLVLKRVNEIEIGNNGMLQTRVVTAPRVPTNPYSPRLTRTLGLSIAMGIFFALLAVFVLDVLDDRFGSADELGEQLETPVLATVPRMAIAVPDPATAEYPAAAIQAIAAPVDADVEAYRGLRTALVLGSSKLAGGMRRVMMTSSEPGDGKTTTLANLGAVFAQSGHRTLVVDADMRRPGLTAMLNLRGERGLSQLLAETAPVAEVAAEVVSETGAQNLWAIAAGLRPQNPSELLSVDRFSEFLAWADSQFDIVLVDAPPVLAVTDPVILSRQVDATVLVVRPDKNPRRAVHRAVEVLRASDAPLVGVVANHLESRREHDYYGGYRYDYGANPEPEAIAA